MTKAHLENFCGEFIGKDPRKLSQADLKALGHVPMSPMAAIRARCLDCCVGNSSEVRKCVAVACPSWPFRMGKNPWRNQVELSDAERERRTNNLKVARKSIQHERHREILSGSDLAATPVAINIVDPENA